MELWKISSDGSQLLPPTHKGPRARRGGAAWWRRARGARRAGAETRTPRAASPPPPHGDCSTESVYGRSLSAVGRVLVQPCGARALRARPRARTRGGLEHDVDDEGDDELRPALHARPPQHPVRVVHLPPQHAAEWLDSGGGGRWRRWWGLALLLLRLLVGVLLAHVARGERGDDEYLLARALNLTAYHATLRVDIHHAKNAAGEGRSPTTRLTRRTAQLLCCCCCSSLRCFVHP